jgi:hypothetical protein
MTHLRLPADGVSPPWSEHDLDLLRRHLRRGSSLIDAAHALGRSPHDVEAKIAELFRPGQGIRGVSTSTAA